MEQTHEVKDVATSENTEVNIEPQQASSATAMTSSPTSEGRGSKIKHEAMPKPGSSEIRHDYTYVFKDLRKIFVLTAVAFAFEIVLSLTASSSYAKLVLRALNLEF